MRANGEELPVALRIVVAVARDHGIEETEVCRDRVRDPAMRRGCQNDPLAIGALAPDEFIIAGTGIVVTFAPVSAGDPIAGILSAQEGRYVNGRWVPRRWLNGDQTHQGRHIRLVPNEFSVQRVKLYRYR